MCSLASLVQLPLFHNNTRNLLFSLGPLSLSNPFLPSPHSECEITPSQPNLCLWPGTWSTLHSDTLTCTTLHTQSHNLHSSFSIHFESFNPPCLPPFVLTLSFAIPHLYVDSGKTQATKGEIDEKLGCNKERE